MLSPVLHHKSTRKRPLFDKKGILENIQHVVFVKMVRHSKKIDKGCAAGVLLTMSAFKQESLISKY